MCKWLQAQSTAGQVFNHRECDCQCPFGAHCRNSEIYNHEAIKADQLAGVPIVKNSKSDSAIIGHMYEKMGGGPELWNALDGIFACVLLDEATGDFTVARDPMGICSLYWGRGQDGSYWFSSEMKGLQHACVSFGYFPPVCSMNPAP